MTISKHADTVADLVRDIHHLLIDDLDLPTKFKNVDPEQGQRYGLLSAQSLSDIDRVMMQLECTFLASGAFGSYWEAQKWAIATSLNLDALLPQMKRKVNCRSILADFEKTSAITCGRPRSPLKANASQRGGDLWIVDVLMPCALKLMIPRDVVCGHL
jgi:hypothetical protein